MTTSTATDVPRQRRWVCVDCDVAVYKMNGELVDRPNGWDDAGRCITCQRKTAAKKDPQEGLLRFELLRGTQLKKAAKQAHVTMAVARAVRQQMVAHGEIEPLKAKANGNEGGPRVGAFSEHKDAIEKTLHEDPMQEDSKIGKEFGVNMRVVRRARERLGLPQPPTPTERDAATLRELGGATSADVFAERIGVQRAQGRRRLRKLVAAGLATVEQVRDGQARPKYYTATTPSTDPGNHPATGGHPLPHPSA